MPDEETATAPAADKDEAIPVAETPTPPVSETPTEAATPVASEPMVLDDEQVKAVLALPQIQQHIAASQKPIQSARDKAVQRANTAEQAAGLSDEEKQTLLDKQAFLNDAIEFYSEAKGVPKEDLEDARDLKELMGRVRLIKATATVSTEAAAADPTVLKAVLDGLKPGTAGTPLAPANGQGPRPGALTEKERIKLLGDGGGTAEDVAWGRQWMEQQGIRLS